MASLLNVNIPLAMSYLQFVCQGFLGYRSVAGCSTVGNDIRLGTFAATEFN